MKAEQEKRSPPSLTAKREILYLIAKGPSNTGVALLLPLSPKTVANYVSNILYKLKVADRKEATIPAA